MKELSDFYFDKDEIYRLVNSFPPETFTGGNHNRTQIMNELASELGITQFQIAPYARVIELVHNATLIHDDVIDESHTRRDNPTLNAKLENRKCILIGDYMLAKAMSELTSFANNKIVAELSRTLKDLVNGEILQSFENEKLLWSKEKYFEISFNKTGSVLRWCLLIPLIVKELDESRSLEVMEKVAYKLGLIYQMLDDVKDFSTLSKKTPFLDINNWNINIVLLNLQSKKPLIADMLRLKRDLDLLTSHQRSQIYNAIKETLFQVDQLSDEIEELLTLELKFPQFSKFLKDFIHSELLKVFKGMVDYDFEVDDKVI